MKNSSRITSLTSLRGVAAILVILFHIDALCFPLTSGGGSSFIRKGYLWVDLFFILSGFIMMHVYGNSFSEKIDRKNFLGFLRARFARIYPLHLFSFLLLLIFFIWRVKINGFVLGDNTIFDTNAIFSNIFLLHSMGFHDHLTWNIPSWSISTEWWIYFIFPLMVMPSIKILRKWRKLALLFITMGYLFIIYFLHPLSKKASPLDFNPEYFSLDVTFDWGFLRCFLGFLLGMLVYDLYHQKKYSLVFSKTSTMLWTSFAIIVALTLNLPDFISIGLFAAILLMTAYNEGWVNKFLNKKILVFLGEISYSLYLMHMLVILFVLIYEKQFVGIMPTEKSLSMSWYYSLIYLAVIIIISTMTYYFIEMPMRKALNGKK